MSAAPPRTRASAFAPASVGNVAIGFDILGFAVEALGDRVTVTSTAAPGV
ncbi:MAG: homoserine kinase, partial [Gammaproteobacteria bacterium]